jgi:PTH2 family peptidyl-tRNA hydrolase
MKNSKQVIIIRSDLNMRKGKMVAQGAHASLSAILNLKKIKFTLRNLIHNREPLINWFSNSHTKICLQVNSEDELLLVYSFAKDRGLICSLIKDSGKTEFNNVPTYTAVAIGPAWNEEIDKITGNLKLL